MTLPFWARLLSELYGILIISQSNGQTGYVKIFSEYSFMKASEESNIYLTKKNIGKQTKY